jgi:hypothetical protein
MGSSVGGLVGHNSGTIINCTSSASIFGVYVGVGGLVGSNDGGISECNSSGEVRSHWYAGGLVGMNSGVIYNCYSSSDFSADHNAGGLVGLNDDGIISNCYSTGSVLRGRDGLVGENSGTVTASFWDIETSGQTTSAGGTGKTTAEMQTASTFLEAGWDFVGESENGTEDIWDIFEGVDYPKLTWELTISADHPDYNEWIELGEPICWRYRRQCHGDADCKSQGKQKYWVSTNDLDILIAAWNHPFSEIEDQTVNGVPLICADFDHKAQSIENYRVSTDDLDILIAHWNKANAPAADCP